MKKSPEDCRVLNNLVKALETTGSHFNKCPDALHTYWWLLDQRLNNNIKPIQKACKRYMAQQGTRLFNNYMANVPE